MRRWLGSISFGIVLVVVVLGGGERTARAAPMSTQLTTVRADATDIVIGTVSNVGTDIVVDVDTVLRGTAKLGPRKVKSSPDGSSYASGRVIVFLDANNAFRWVGGLVAGSKIESGVVHLSGFFDFNAHIVSPGIMTLAQLKDFLANGTLKQKFAGTVVFEDGHGALVPSSHTFGVDYDALTQKATVSGITASCLGNVFVHGIDWGDFHLTLNGDCPPPAGKTNPGSRSVELLGKYTGVDPKGAILVEATPTRPFLDPADYATFLSDSSLATVKRLLDVKLVDGSKWTWDVGNGLVDAQGTVHAAGGFSSSSQTTNGVTTNLQTYDFGGPSIVLSPSGGGTMSTGGYALGLVTMIDTGTYGACILKELGKPDRNCTLGRGRSQMVKR